MKKTIPKLLTLVCLLVAVMGLSIVTVHAASGHGHRQQRQRVPLPRGQDACVQWGPYTSNQAQVLHPERHRGDCPGLLHGAGGALRQRVICSIPPHRGTI